MSWYKDNNQDVILFFIDHSRLILFRDVYQYFTLLSILLHDFVKNVNVLIFILRLYQKGFKAYKRIIVLGDCLTRCLVAIIIRCGLIPLVWVWLILQLYALMRFWDNTTIVIWYFQHVSYNNSIKSVRIAAMLAIIVSLFYPNNLHERL